MIKISPERDSLLTDFSKATLNERYLLQEGNVFENDDVLLPSYDIAKFETLQEDKSLENEIKNHKHYGKNVLTRRETYQELFARVSTAYSDNEEHAQRLYDYMSKLWFMPASPVLVNGGTSRGLPISCFLNKTQDTMEGIANIFAENTHLASSGGGIGTDWSLIREMNAPINNRGVSSGVIPFVKVQDSYGLAVSQGGLRGGKSAVYMNISHPEIEEFIDVRRPTGGDNNRRSLNVHHGVILEDEFMQAVRDGESWELKSPHNGKVVETINARDLWVRILASRIETGEPYIVFQGNMDKNKSDVYEALGLRSTQSNLCSEIHLHTGYDYNKKERTAVCCLSSLNLEYYEAWKDDSLFIEDVMRFLDNVLQAFIDKAPDTIKNAKYSAMMERSVGLGVMGFHSFLQSKKTPFDGVAAKSWNQAIFKHIRGETDKANEILANEKGACPDAQKAGINKRFANTMAIAPTASISIIAGGSSAGIEPFMANAFSQKTLSGTFVVRNKHFKKLLQAKGYDNETTWSSIAQNEGSVQHLEYLTPEEKEVFKTAMEINQLWLINHAADRQKFIDQGQSLNLFVPPKISKKELHDIHFIAWKSGVKALYYCRSMSIQRAEKGNSEKSSEIPVNENKYDECLACQ